MSSLAVEGGPSPAPRGGGRGPVRRPRPWRNAWNPSDHREKCRVCAAGRARDGRRHGAGWSGWRSARLRMSVVIRDRRDRSPGGCRNSYTTGGCSLAPNLSDAGFRQLQSVHSSGLHGLVFDLIPVVPPEDHVGSNATRCPARRRVGVLRCAESISLVARHVSATNHAFVGSVVARHEHPTRPHAPGAALAAHGAGDAAEVPLGGGK